MESLHGGLGIMADDIVAGLYAAFDGRHWRGCNSIFLRERRNAGTKNDANRIRDGVPADSDATSDETLADIEKEEQVTDLKQARIDRAWTVAGWSP